MITILFALLRGICQLPAYVACEKGFLQDVGVEPAVTISPTAWMPAEPSFVEATCADSGQRPNRLRL